MIKYVDIPDYVNNKITIKGLYNKYKQTFKKGYRVQSSNKIKPHLSREWNEETFATYCKRYEEILIPFLYDNIEEKTVANYEPEAVERALSDLKEQNNFSENLIEDYQHLFWTLYKTGSDNGDFIDRLLWELTGKEKSNIGKSSNLEEMIKTLKRSFSIEEEENIANWFLLNLNPENTIGEVYGVLLMFCLALRNAEAAGVKFKDFKLSNGDDFYYVNICRTTIEDTNELKTGGKTRNMFRQLPIFPFLETIIKERLEAITKSLIKSNNISYEEAKNIALDYTVACQGKNYEKITTRNNISRMGKKILDNAYVDYIKNNAIIKKVFEQKLEDAEIFDADPTTYIFRRNGATHLYTLGMTDSQIQYYMGHEVEDSQDKRSYYVNADRLAQLNAISKMHPLNYLFNSSTENNAIKAELKKGESVYIRVAAKEPQDPIYIKVESSKDLILNYSISNSFIPYGYNATVDIRQTVLNEYKKVKERETV